MTHLLATRYQVKEDFAITKTLEKMDNLEKKVKEEKAAIIAKEKEKKDGENQKELEEMKAKYGNNLNQHKNEVRNAKIKIGGEMYKRFMQGFNKIKNEDDKEAQENTHFLFKKLHF